MRPITVDLSPSEALHLVGLLGIIARDRRRRGLSARLTERIFVKVDTAILDATAREEPK